MVGLSAELVLVLALRAAAGELALALGAAEPLVLVVAVEPAELLVVGRAESAGVCAVVRAGALRGLVAALLLAWGVGSSQAASESKSVKLANKLRPSLTLPASNIAPGRRAGGPPTPGRCECLRSAACDGLAACRA